MRVYGASLEVPRGQYEQVGLIIRQTPANEELDPTNWEYLVTGGHGHRRIIDYKSTKNSESAYHVLEVQGPWIELRLARWS